jgi:hypothetical protein
MEEAFGFLSRRVDEGLWIEADDGQKLFVQCVNESGGHKTDSNGENIQVAGVDLRLTEAALKSNEESKDTLTGGRHVNEDVSPKTDSSDVSKDSSESNMTMNSIMEEAFGFLSSRADEGLWIEADDGQKLFVRCVNESEGHKTNSKGENNESSGVDLRSAKAALMSNEETKDTLTDGRHVKEDMSPKSDSSDVSEDSSESNTTMNSIMEEAFGFLSRRTDKGLWIEADDGQKLFVRCVNESKGHKTDSKGENNEAVRVDLRSTDAALKSNKERKDTFRVEAADVFEGSESSNSSDSSEGSCQTGSNDSSLSSDDTTIKSDSTLGSIINEAIGSLARASEGGRLITAEDGSVMYIRKGGSS